MKLSELLLKPFKLKGGSTLNLRGFSKRVVDKEVGEGGGGSESGVIDKIIEQYYNTQMIPHPSKFYNETTGDIIDILDIDQGDNYYFLYKVSDYMELPSNKNINTYFRLGDGIMSLHFLLNTDAGIQGEAIIDGEAYVALG